MLTGEPVRLERPLSTLPLTIGEWKGVELSMDKRVVEVAGCDDYVYRRYVDASTNRTVDLYVAYAARPANMLGHRPEVCYPTHGWATGPVRKLTLTLPDGRPLECLVRQVSRADGSARPMVVLNYYIVQGRHLTDWTDFWGPRWRMPNLARDPSFYVTQVQVTVPVSTSPATAEALAAEFAAAAATAVGELMPTQHPASAPEASAK